MGKKPKNLDINKLYFFDESRINTAMQRLYDWGKKSSLVNAPIKDTRFERISVMAALGLDGVRAPLEFSSTLNTEIFKSYVEQFLAPEMKKRHFCLITALFTK